MNDMNDGSGWDSNPEPLSYQANTLPTELLYMEPNCLIVKIILESDVRCEI